MKIRRKRTLWKEQKSRVRVDENFTYRKKQIYASKLFEVAKAHLPDVQTILISIF